ncbi:DUF4385 domain-containing protein [Tengunoibacter tsumagoiensis]|uniref:DUF4385 domain-containing protein n=1 Tax=Tengunoibacter tsumagoiensis TaxID=2014871 RepID=A0A402A1K5_9CHLR|nr:DUF4385 domain-containing protein [Tengunoibacter tsumagoiensis]GCE12929.1 hypothetical protein KTT_27880 [Tengunoibacter tsumagoiensis]
MFDYGLDYQTTNFREQPHLYRVGKGEQGVLLVEPYKSEILPYWHFKTPAIAQESSEKIYQLFLAYKEQQDFVGMDMARKFLQMGYTRSRRYANHRSGKKYVQNPQKLPANEQQAARKQINPQEPDWDRNEKAQSSRIFYEKYLLVKNDPDYQFLLKRHKNLYR